MVHFEDVVIKISQHNKVARLLVFSPCWRSYCRSMTYVSGVHLELEDLRVERGLAGV